jgi:hypothetical protein
MEVIIVIKRLYMLFKKEEFKFGVEYINTIIVVSNKNKEKDDLFILFIDS